MVLTRVHNGQIEQEESFLRSYECLGPGRVVSRIEYFSWELRLQKCIESNALAAVVFSY